MVRCMCKGQGKGRVRVRVGSWSGSGSRSGSGQGHKGKSKGKGRARIRVFRGVRKGKRCIGGTGGLVWVGDRQCSSSSNAHPRPAHPRRMLPLM
jgi:hypothetical protein